MAESYCQPVRDSVHGHKLKPGWAVYSVTHILVDNPKPWKNFPAHSGIIEVGSFVAWLKSHAKRYGKQATTTRKTRERKREAAMLIDDLHPHNANASFYTIGNPGGDGGGGGRSLLTSRESRYRVS